MARLSNPTSSRDDNDSDTTNEKLASMTITPGPNSPDDIIPIFPSQKEQQQQQPSNPPTSISKETPSFSPSNNDNDHDPDYDQSSDSSSPPRRPKVQSKARAKKARKAQTQAQSSPSITATANTVAPTRSPLRPAKDILSRIRHDPSLDKDEYVVGYRDRHADVQEMPVTSWKGGDVTDEEFIPQHRVLYFRKKEEGEGESEGEGEGVEGEEEEKGARGDRGVKVWDRKERKDLLFGSGKGGGERGLIVEKEVDEMDEEDEEQSDGESAGEANTVTKE